MIARRIGDRPFMFMSSGGRGPDQLGPLFSDFSYNLPGWRHFLTLIRVGRVVPDRLGITPDEIDSGHCPALSRPQELTDRLHTYWDAVQRLEGDHLQS